MNKKKQKKEIVKFLEVRTFGDIIGVPFQFIIQEFKLFAGTLLKYAGPFIAVMFLVSALLADDIYNSVLMKTNTSDTITVYTIILILALMLGILSVVVVTHSYITLYVRKGKGNFTKDDVGELLKKKIWKVLGVGFIAYLLTGIGVLLFYIPGIYLGITLSFVFIIIIYEEKTVGQTISRSFQVIKGNWWKTFALILVFGMIIGAMSYVFIIPIYIIFIFAAFSGSQIGAGSVIVITLFAFLYFAAYMFFMAMQQIMIAFQYFNISAEKDGIHLKDRIAAINKEEEKTSENQKTDISEKDETTETKDNEQNRFLEEDDINRFRPKE